MTVYGPENCLGYVYIWRDRKRKMFYLGSHFYGSKTYICGSKRMKNAFRKRPQDFTRRILMTIKEGTREDLQKIEQRWLSLINAKELGSRYYNLTLCAGGGQTYGAKGWSHSEEAKERIRAYQKGRQKPKEHVENIIKAHTGAKRSEDAIKRMKEAQQKRRQNEGPESEEIRKKRSESGKRKIFSPEHRKNISIAQAKRHAAKRLMSQSSLEV